MFDTLIALGTIGIQLFIVVTIIAWIRKAPFIHVVARHSGLLLRVLFVGAAVGSLIYSEILNFAPCILCWYQRLAIFPLAILSFTTNLAKSTLLRLQVLILGSAGLAVALYHKYLEIFPNSSSSVCGPDGVSCTVLYVYEFGYITIPMMSLTVLLAGILLSLVASRFPQESLVRTEK